MRGSVLFVTGLLVGAALTTAVAQNANRGLVGVNHVGMNVPNLDEAYRFDRDTTLAILAGFAHNRRVMIQGYHGTGKSTHIEQVASRLNWPCVRVNLDSHISRIDLIGKDAIVLKDGKPTGEYVDFLTGFITTGSEPWGRPACVTVATDGALLLSDDRSHTIYRISYSR